MSTRLKIINNLNSLRAIAALLVFVSHLFQIFWLPLPGVAPLLRETVHIISESAVLVFFILSGYLISMSIMTNVTRNNQAFLSSEYTINRVARIYPPLLLAILVSLLSFKIIAYYELPGSNSLILGALGDNYHAREHLHFSFKEMLMALALYGGLLEVNGPLWSLYIEVKMYVFAGLLAALIYSSSSYIKALSLIFLALIIYKLFPNSSSYYYPLWWGIGVVFYFFHNYSLKVRVLLCMLIPIFLSILSDNIAITLIQYVVISTIFWAAIIFKRGNDVLSDVASVSYTLYLLHFPIFILIYSIFSSYYQLTIPTLPVRVVVSIVAALSTYYVAKILGSKVENTALFRNLITSACKNVGSRL